MKAVKNLVWLLTLTIAFIACEEPVGPEPVSNKADVNAPYGSDPIADEYGDLSDKYADQYRTDNGE